MKNCFRVLCSLFALSIVGAQVLAQTPGQTTQGWNYTDPINITESRRYATLFYEYQDTGIMTPEFAAFRFTNPAPQGTMTPFYGTELLFDKIYASRLNYNGSSPSYYTLSDLRRDDPDVEAAFRLYATTGVLKTPFAAQATASIEHLNAVSTAGEAGSNYELVEPIQVTLAGEYLESLGIAVAQRASTSTTLSTQSPQSHPVADAIKRELPGVPAGNPPYSVPYWPDGEKPCAPGGPDDGYKPNDGFCVSPGHPGFDCDDYALA